MPLTRPKAHQLAGQSAKSSVRVVTTSNVTLSGGTPATVDGVSLTLEDRVLVTAQTDATENGIYRVTSVGSGSNGTWVRSRDANQNEEVLAGMTCIVSEGTSYADTFWKLTTDGAVTLGTTELTFEQHSSGGSSFANLSDVTLTSTSSNDILTYNGSAWVNNTAINLSGNITGGNLLTGNVTIADSTITATGNITTSGSFIGDGSQLTGVSSYTDSDAQTFLSSGNITGANIAGTILGNTTVQIQDNVQLRFGAGNDLRIYHDGTTNDSWIRTISFGNLYIRGRGVYIQNQSAEKYFFGDYDTGEVTLYKSDSARLTTTTDGVTVVGNISGGNLLTGNVTVSDATITVDNVTYTGTDGTTGQALLTYGNGVTYFGNVATDSGATYTASTTAPVSPSVGDKWFDTTDDILFEYINDGTSNVWVDTTSASTGDSTTGDYSITGDLTAGGNVATGNVTVTDSTITATGNITSGNIISSGSISAGGNYLSSQPSFRNLIINGDMRIDQRNAGASVTPTANAYLTDRWQLQISGVTNAPTYQQVTDAPTGFQYSLKATVNSSEVLDSGDSVTFRQRIEGFNTAHLLYGTSDAKTVTVSFWVKSSLTGTFNVSIANGGFNRGYIAEYTISSANTWEYKTVTIPGDTTGPWSTDNTTGLLLMFNLDSGSSFDGASDTWLATNDRATVGAVKLVGTSGATWQITGVQLEVGSTATPFEHRPYDVELARCQRYYWKLLSESAYACMSNTNMATSGTNGGTMIPLKVKMRASPTSSYGGSMSLGDGTANYNITSLTIASAQTNTNLAFLNVAVASGLTTYRWYRLESNGTTTAYIDFSAEL